MTPRTAIQAVGWGLAVLGLLAAPVRANSLPVFRQALEQWPAADYEVVVFHRGALADEHQALVDSLCHAREQSFANVTAQTVDVSSQMDKSMEELWSGQTDPVPPWLVVRAPEASPDAAPVWTGPLTTATVQSLLDSPARRKIAEALLGGATAVWVLLECGESIRDEAAVDLLSAALKKLEKKLPVSAAGPLRSPLPLQVDFDLVRVTRNDPAEEFFVTLLQHGKPLFSARPVAFPVFGRGRTPGALVGREIDEEGIHAACASIVSACSPDGRETHSGRDLLLAANWSSIFDPALARKPSAITLAVLPVPVSSIARSATAADNETGNRWNWLVTLSVIALGTSALAFGLSRRARRIG